MKNKSRTLLRATIFFFGCILAALAPATAFAETTLVIVQGSGDLEVRLTALTVFEAQEVNVWWQTDQLGTTGGTWQVTNIATGEKVTGDSGPFVTRFTIPASAFIQTFVATPIVTTTKPPAQKPSAMKFSITIVPHNNAQQSLGLPSAAVVVTQMPEGQAPPPVNFKSALFPSVKVVKYAPSLDAGKRTFDFASSVVTLRVSNNTKKPTDPILLKLYDANALMRQALPNQSKVAGLRPGASLLLTVYLIPILPQSPGEQAFVDWNQRYGTLHCAIQPKLVMDWDGIGETPSALHHVSTPLPGTWSYSPCL